MKYQIKENNTLLAIFICLVILAGVTNAIISGLNSKTAKVVDQTITEAVKEITIDDIKVINIEQRWVEPIENASKEFGVDPLLIYGIANAESGLGKYFYNEYDKDNCFNLWGLKGGNTGLRMAQENSYLRCFNDEVAGARTIAKTLKLYYLDEGRDTPEKICQKWIGATHAKANCPHWINNVNKIVAKN